MSNLKIGIKEPCQENWDKMTTANQGRFCGSCSKTVVDFTKMSLGDIKAYFKGYAGGLCGRFSRIQLSGGMRFDDLALKTRLFLRALAFVFILNMPLEAEGQSTNQIQVTQILKGSVVCLTPTQVSGQVFMSDGNSLEGTVLELMKNGTTLFTRQFNKDGHFVLSLEPGSYVLRVAVEGYERIEYPIEVDGELKKEIEPLFLIPQYVESTMGEVVMGDINVMPVDSTEE